MNARYIIGIDEVGRGPVAGPVVLCAVCLPARASLAWLKDIKDSKKLKSKDREEWVKKAGLKLKSKELTFSIKSISAKEIDKIGISNSIKKALAACLAALELNLKFNQLECKVLLDGSLYAPKEFKNQKTIIKGDEKIKHISLASNLAKVYRDNLMINLSKKNPEYRKYQFEKHKGYGTKLHLDLIKEHGLSPVHRKSFLKNINSVDQL
jgi:ribonuclease HII